MNDVSRVHTISVLVENEFGVLARVAGMFAGRGFNIDALSVAPTDDPRLSRITLVTHGHEGVVEQILKQLHRLIDVIRVVDVSNEDCIRRELMLAKVQVEPAQTNLLFEILENYAGKIVDDLHPQIRIVEFVAEHQRIEELLQSLQKFRLLEVVRTGNVAMQKGNELLMNGAKR